MKKLFFLFSMLFALSVGQMFAATKTEGFETATAGSNYQSTVTVSTAQSDCGISWEIYYGTISTNSKIAGNNSAALRLYTTANYGYLKTTTAINGLTQVSFKAKAATTNSASIKIDVKYSTDGTNWSPMKLTSASGSNYTAQNVASSATSYTAYIPTGVSGDIYFQIAINSGSTKPSSKNAQLTIDDVMFTYTPATSGTCLTPTFSPVAGTYEGTQNVTITSTDEATIYYTIDGTTPTTSSSVYSSAIAVNANTTIKAFATKSGFTDSQVGEATYTITKGPDVTLDFTSNTNWNFPNGQNNIEESENSFTNGDYTIKVAGSSGKGYYFNSGKLLIGQSGAYIVLPTFETPIEKIVCPGVSGASGKVTWNIYKGTTAVCSEVTGCTTDQTFEFENPEENNQYTIRVTNGNNLQISKIKIYYGEAPAVAKPTISGDESFVSTTTITISHADADAIYYTTNGDAPTTSSTQYSEPFTLNATSTVKAIAVKGSDVSAVAEKTFDKIVPMTVAQAKSAVDAATSNTLANQYVKGIISQVDGFNSTYNSITYWISDDGTTTNQFEVYSGKGLNNTNFSAATDLNVGDDVTVFGIIKLYNSTYEFDKNNYIVARKPIAVLSWSDLVEGAFTASLEGENTYPTLNKPNGISVTYNSSNTAIATISAEGAITPKAIGQTTITATFAGNDSYKANSVSYSLNVASSVVRVNVTFEENGGSAVDDLTEQTNLPSPLPAITKAGKNFGGWYTDSEFNTPAEAGASITENTTLYAQWLEPYTVAQALSIINAYADNGTSDGDVYVAGIISQIDSYNSQYHSITYWISDDGETTTQLEVYSGKGLNGANFSSVDDLTTGDQVIIYGQLKKYVKNSTTTPEINQNNQLYSRQHEDVVVDVERVTLNETTISLIEGKTATLIATVLPNNAPDKSVRWISNNEAVATVAAGVVTAVAEGTTTIRATSVADDTKYAECTVTVTSQPGNDDIRGNWIRVTDASTLKVGMKIIIASIVDDEVFTIGMTQNTNNRSAVDGATVDGNQLTPADGTAVFTLEAGTEENTFAFKSSENEYLYAASSSKNYLRSQNTNDANGSWTISITNGAAIVTAQGSNTRNLMRYNSSDNLFSCYASGQKDVVLYALETYERTGLEVGRHYTICLPKKIIAVRGATFWGINNGDATAVYMELQQPPFEAGTPFIFYATASTLEVVYEGDETTETISNGALRGTLTDMNHDALVAAGSQVYLMYNNALHPLGTNNHLDANRAYLLFEELQAGAPAPGRQVKRMPLQTDVTTGIEDAEASAQPKKMLIDGQLFIRCGEKLYNATGSMVK